MKDALLIIFVKNPELGKAKTRLAQTIGKEKALAIYRMLLERTKDVTFDLEVDIQVHYNQFIDRNDLWDDGRYIKKKQIEGDLGQKMQFAFEEAFSAGYEKICIIGSDCYDLNKKHLEEAFLNLETSEFVLGPSFDGGYYLMGMRALLTSVFSNKQWSTNSVFNDTLKDIKKDDKSYTLLSKLSDVDVEADLGPWASEILKS